MMFLVFTFFPSYECGLFWRSISALCACTFGLRMFFRGTVGMMGFDSTAAFSSSLKIYYCEHRLPLHYTASHLSLCHTQLLGFVHMSS